MASLGVIAATALKAVGKETNTSLLRSLETSSENLTRISEAFAKILANREIKVHSFLEEHSITSIAGVGKVRGDPFAAG
jgi:fructose-1,6-bisphosphatase/sedoheptulose 1,7-bisphosphatase-like protein